MRRVLQCFAALAGLLTLSACVPRDESAALPAAPAPPAATAAGAPAAKPAPPAGVPAAAAPTAEAPPPPGSQAARKPAPADPPAKQPGDGGNRPPKASAAAAKPGVAASRHTAAVPQVPGRTTVSEAQLGLRFFPRAKQGLATVTTAGGRRTTIVQLSTGASVAEAHAFYEQALGQPLLANRSSTTPAGRTATLVKVHGKTQFTVSMSRVQDQTLITILRTDQP